MSEWSDADLGPDTVELLPDTTPAAPTGEGVDANGQEQPATEVPQGDDFDI